MTALARAVIDMLLTPCMQTRATVALSARGLGSCEPAAFTGFTSWATRTGTCTVLHSPAAMLLIAEDRRSSARLVGAAPYDPAAIEARDTTAFAHTPNARETP